MENIKKNIKAESGNIKSKIVPEIVFTADLDDMFRFVC